MKLKHKFYVGAKSLTQKSQDALPWETPTPTTGRGGYVKATLGDAIRQAEELVREDGIDRYVVKIVRLVKKADQPIRVEVVT